MAKFQVIWATALVVVTLASFDGPSARAADGPGSEVLKKHGLRLAGSLAVAQEETGVKSKLSDARRLYKQLNYSLMQQKGTISPQELQKTVKSLNAEINQLRSQMNAVNQQMAQVPRGMSRYGSRFGGSSFSNNYAAEMYAELAVYKNQLQMELNQDSMFLNQIKSQAADPKAKDKVDAEVRERREDYHQALLDLRKLVDSTTEKYEELSKNAEVKKALVLAGKGLREKPKLGPSRDFLANVKLLERFEKADSSSYAEEPQTKPTRRSRQRTRGKASANEAAGATATDGADKPDGS